MKPLLLRIEIPFSYYRDIDTDTGRPLVMPPKPEEIHQYALALQREIAASSENMEDYEISGIYIGGGIGSVLNHFDLHDLMGCIRKYLPAAADCETLLTTFPGSMDFDIFSTWQRSGISTLMFEIPGLIQRECTEHHLPQTMQVMDSSKYFLDSVRFTRYGFRLLSGVPGRSENRYRKLLLEMKRYTPEYITFTALNKDVNDFEQFPQLEEYLNSLGYQRYAEKLYARPGKSPGLFGMAGEYLGIGAGAVTCMDGYFSENITDWRAYTSYGGDFSKTVSKVYAVNNLTNSGG